MKPLTASTCWTAHLRRMKMMPPIVWRAMQTEARARAICCGALPFLSTTPSTRRAQNYGGGQAKAFRQVGDYLFFAYGYGHVRVLNKTDGTLVETLTQNVNGWKGTAGQLDAAYGLRSIRNQPQVCSAHRKRVVGQHHHVSLESAPGSQS
jgi:hypothetical protein